MTDKEWMQLELNRMVKAEGGKVSVERMTEIVSELNQRLRENPNLPREVNTLTADELIARARKKTGEERYRIIKRVLRMEPDNITAACMRIEYLAKNADDRIHHYEDLTRKATARLQAAGVFSEENIGKFWQLPATKPYMYLRLSYLESLIGARKLRLAAKECAEMLVRYGADVERALFYVCKDFHSYNELYIDDLPSVIRYLCVHFSADKNAVDAEGNRPYDIVKKQYLEDENAFPEKLKRCNDEGERQKLQEKFEEKRKIYEKTLALLQ